MKNKAIQSRAEQIKLFPSENIKTAVHLEAAAKYHSEAVKHFEDGNYGKATQSKIIAKEHLRIASEALIEEIYHPTLNSEFEI